MSVIINSIAGTFIGIWCKVKFNISTLIIISAYNALHLVFSSIWENEKPYYDNSYLIAAGAIAPLIDLKLNYSFPITTIGINLIEAGLHCFN
jgi:hypothetical protein